MRKTSNTRVLGMLCGGILCLATAGTLVATVATTQARPVKQVGPWDAMKAATAKVPGSRAFSATYAKEGNKWLYDVIVIHGTKITEVEVDATTGKVGDTEVATPAGEGQEMTAELSKAIGAPAPKMSEKAESGEKGEADEKPLR